MDQRATVARRNPSREMGKAGCSDCSARSLFTLCPFGKAGQHRFRGVPRWLEEYAADVFWCSCSAHVSILATVPSEPTADPETEDFSSIYTYIRDFC